MWQKSKTFLYQRLWALFFVGALCSLSLEAQITVSKQNLLPPLITVENSENLWQTLLPLARSLPQQSKDYHSNLLSQVSSLQISNRNLTLQLNEVLNSNALLMVSLAQSQEQVLTLTNSSNRLRKDLNDSTATIIQLDNDLYKAEADAILLKRGVVFLEIVVAVFVVYEGGRLVKIWN